VAAFQEWVISVSILARPPDVWSWVQHRNYRIAKLRAFLQANRAAHKRAHGARESGDAAANTIEFGSLSADTAAQSVAITRTKKEHPGDAQCD
jgi:hypothetical protein